MAPMAIGGHCSVQCGCHTSPNGEWGEGGGGGEGEEGEELFLLHLHLQSIHMNHLSAFTNL